MTIVTYVRRPKRTRKRKAQTAEIAIPRIVKPISRNALYGGKRNDGGIIRLFTTSPLLATGLIPLAFEHARASSAHPGLHHSDDDRRQRGIRRRGGPAGYAFPAAGRVVHDRGAAGRDHDANVELQDFRGYGFWSHPLTGATATALACFMILGIGMRWRTIVVLLGIFVVGLLTYGGRGALLTTMLMLTTSALFQFASGLATRRLNVGFVGEFIARVIILPALFVVLLSTTDMGARDESEYVGSAQVRLVQWRVLDHLTLAEALKGVTNTEVNQLKELLGLTGAGRGYRESVAVPYLGLGLIGFPFLLASLFFFMLLLGRREDSAVSWLIVIAMLLICSTSNSLGRNRPISTS